MNKSIVGAIAVAAFFSHAPAAERPHVIPPQRVAHYWLLESSSAQARVPNSGRNLSAPSCAAVAYTIEKNGSTSNVKLERLVPPGDLGNVAVRVVAGMQFAPTPQNLGKDRVSTYVVMPFNLPAADPNKPDVQALRARVLAPCELKGFGKPADNVVNIVQ
ncbi:MAG: hypothetical protein WBV39_04475 [Rudaea sp.]